MTAIDRVKLQAYLINQLAYMDTALEALPGDERLVAARTVYVRVQEALDFGTFDVDAPHRAEPGEQIPMDEIEVPVKFKVRRHDPDTSWKAAYEVSRGRQRLLFQAIYRLLEDHPRTDSEIRAYMDAHHFDYGAEESVTKRRGELVEAGWVVATEERHLSAHNKPMIVWAAVPEVHHD